MAKSDFVHLYNILLIFQDSLRISMTESPVMSNSYTKTKYPLILNSRFKKNDSKQIYNTYLTLSYLNEYFERGFRGLEYD